MEEKAAAGDDGEQEEGDDGRFIKAAELPWSGIGLENFRNFGKSHGKAREI